MLFNKGSVYVSLKKTSLFILILLVILSIYNDLSGNYPKYSYERNVRIENRNQAETFSAVQVIVQPGQSVLSITEQINKSIEKINIEQIMEDFKALNPGVDPLQLQSNQMYYFPLY